MAPAARTGGRRSTSTARTPSAQRRSPTKAGDLHVRRMARATDDGYDNWAVPGLRATVEAQRLADEIAFSAARLAQLESDPPGLYADAAALGGEEGLWLAFLIAYLSPLEGDDPWAGIAAARTSWATGELPDLEGVRLGPRAGHDPTRGLATLTAYRARAERAGSQAAALAAGEASLNPQRRFDRAFERLSLPGLRRAPRFEFLIVAGRLGLIDVAPSSLMLSADPTDATVVAAKRILGIGDAIDLGRRASEFAADAAVPIAALDLAFLNWARPEDDRIAAGSTAQPDAAVRERVARTLGMLGHPSSQGASPSPLAYNGDDPHPRARDAHRHGCRSHRARELVLRVSRSTPIAAEDRPATQPVRRRRPGRLPAHDGDPHAPRATLEPRGAPLGAHRVQARGDGGARPAPAACRQRGARPRPRGGAPRAVARGAARQLRAAAQRPRRCSGSSPRSCARCG